MGIPCLTLRPNTERPITIDEGTSTLIGTNTEFLRECIESILEGDYPVGSCPELWDGQAGERVAKILAQSMGVETLVERAPTQVLRAA